MVRFFKKYHKWIGLFFSFFIIMFAFSGIVLNHRETFSGVDISRSWLPKSYHYDNWNNGAIKGSIKLSPDSMLLYGGSGIWLTDSLHRSFTDFGKGLKSGADNYSVSNIVQVSNGDIYAATTFNLYKLTESGTWEVVANNAGIDERISDLAMEGDTLVVLTRSHVYTAVAPFDVFTQAELGRPADYTSDVSLFRTLWLLHSGELFGLTGKLFVDALGIMLIILCVTGIIYTFCPGIIKRKKKKSKPVTTTAGLMKKSIKWHNKLGAIFLIFFLILAISGMFLRPPLLIAIIRSNVKAIPGTVLSSDNAWHDKLRCLRYDSAFDEWILYSSAGFYTMKDLKAVPVKMKKTPPVSVMGVTVLEPMDSGWIVGSFSGLYYWEREADLIVDCYTGKPVEGRPMGGRPVFTHTVSGYAGDFGNKKVVFEYSDGVQVFDSDDDFAPMPDAIKKKHISLWHTCLEIHVGRAYRPFIGPFSDLFVTLSGLILVFILVSGYIVYRKRYKKKKCSEA